MFCEICFRWFTKQFEEEAGDQFTCEVLRTEREGEKEWGVDILDTSEETTAKCPVPIRKYSSKQSLSLYILFLRTKTWKALDEHFLSRWLDNKR